MAPGQVMHLSHVLQRQRRPPGVVVGCLHADQGCLEPAPWLHQDLLQPFEVHRPGDACDRLIESARQRCCAAFRRVDVRGSLRHHEFLAGGLRQDGREVPHGRAGYEESGLLAQQSRNAALQFFCRRIAVQAVIAQRRLQHALVHRLRRLRDCVAAQVDRRFAISQRLPPFS